MSVYIAGPMTGIKEFNFSAFDEAKVKLENSVHHDDVISPADLCRAEGFDETCTTGNENLKDLGLDLDLIIFRDLHSVMECDAIYMLDGWTKCKGARAEHAVAVWAGKKILRGWSV